MSTTSRRPGLPAHAPDQGAVVVAHGDDLDAVGPAHDRHLFAPAPLGAHVGAAVGAAEAVGLVVDDDGAVALADDAPIARLLDDDAAAFGALAAQAAQLVDARRLAPDVDGDAGGEALLAASRVGIALAGSSVPLLRTRRRDAPHALRPAGWPGAREGAWAGVWAGT